MCPDFRLQLTFFTLPSPVWGRRGKGRVQGSRRSDPKKKCRIEASRKRYCSEPLQSVEVHSAIFDLLLLLSKGQTSSICNVCTYLDCFEQFGGTLASNVHKRRFGALRSINAKYETWRLRSGGVSQLQSSAKQLEQEVAVDLCTSCPSLHLSAE